MGCLLGEGKTCLFADGFLFSFVMRSVDQCCPLLLLDVPDIGYTMFLYIKKKSKLIVMCENVKLLECVYLFMDIKPLEENGLMSNNAFPNLLL